MTKTNKLVRMGRRRFVKSLAGLGLSSGALQHMDKETLESLTDDPTQEVPRLGALVHTNHDEVMAGEAKPEREPRYYTISRDEWIDVESAHDAARRLENQLSDAVDSNFVRFGVKTTQGSTSRRAVVVRHDTLADRDTEPNVTASELRDLVPATMTGQAGSGDNAEIREDIPVVVEEQEISLLGCGSEWDYDYDYSPVPAGAMMTGKKNGDSTPGTTCTPAYYDGDDLSDWVMLTAGHLYGNETGNSAWQPCPSVEYGTCYKSEFRWDDEDSGDRDPDADRAFDWAVVKLDSDHDTTYKFADNNGGTKNWEVNGIIGWDNIKDGTMMNKQGARTEYQSGEVDEVFTNHTFETTASANGGDSGGPNFKENWYEYPTSFKGIGGVTSYAADSGTGVIWSGKAEQEWPVSI